MTDDTRYQEQCAGYALDALAPDERVAFERALAHASAREREFLGEMRDVVAAMAMRLASVKPSARVRMLVMARSRSAEW